MYIQMFGPHVYICAYTIICVYSTFIQNKTHLLPCCLLNEYEHVMLANPNANMLAKTNTNMLANTNGTGRHGPSTGSRDQAAAGKTITAWALASTR